MSAKRPQKLDVPFVPAETRADGTRIHTCAICGTRGPWTEQWRWYGSIRDLEDGWPILKLCSAVCKSHAIFNKYVPPNAPDLDQIT